MATGKVIQRIIELKDKFTPNLNKMQKGTVQFKRDVVDLKKVGASAFKGIAVGIAAAGVAAIGAGVGFTALVNKTAQAGDRIDKMSQKLGMTFQGFQELDYILGQNGMSIDSMGMGIKTLTQHMDGVNQGSKGSIELFRRLGINASVSSKSQEEAFKDVVSAFQGMEQGAEKSALALKIFGRNGQDLMPMLNQSNGDIQQLEQNYRKLGIAMSDEAVTNSVIFGDTLDDLKLGIAGMFRSLSSPALSHFNRGLQWLVDKIPIVRQFGVDTFNAIRQAIEKNVEKFDAIKSVFVDIKNGIASAFGSDGEGGGAVVWFVDTAIPAVVGGVASVLEGVANTYNFIKDNWTLIGPIVYGIVGALTAYHLITKAIIIATHAKTAALLIWKAAINTTPIGWLITGIGLLIAAGVFLVKNWDDVKLAGQKVWNGLVSGVEWAANLVVKGINWMVEKALAPINLLISGLNKILGVDIKPIEFGGISEVSFGGAQFDTEGKEFKMGKKKEEDTFENTLAQFDKQQEIKVQTQQASNTKLIDSLDDNTATMKGTAGKINDIHVTLYASDLSAEEVATILVPKLKRELFA